MNLAQKLTRLFLQALNIWLQDKQSAFQKTSIGKIFLQWLINSHE